MSDFDITTAPVSELLGDFLDCQADIALCRFALTMGVTTYGDGCEVQERLERNQIVFDLINAELARREAMQ